MSSLMFHTWLPLPANPACNHVLLAARRFSDLAAAKQHADPLDSVSAFIF